MEFLALLLFAMQFSYNDMDLTGAEILSLHNKLSFCKITRCVSPSLFLFIAGRHLIPVWWGLKVLTCNLHVWKGVR